MAAVAEAELEYGQRQQWGAHKSQTKPPSTVKPKLANPNNKLKDEHLGDVSLE